MERKKLWKRGLSFGLVLVTAVSVGLSPLPEGLLTLTANAATKTYALPQSDLALGAPVVPKALEGDSSFKDGYIRGGAMSLNKYFKMTTDSNSNQSKGNTLTRSKIMHDDTGAGWKAVYKWSCTDAQMALLGNSAYKLKYEGNAISEKHTRTYWEGWNCYLHQKGWDWVNLEIKDSGWPIWTGRSYLQDSGKGQAVSWSRDDWSPKGNYIEYIAQSYNCKCGESGVSGSTFWFVDTTIPKITNTYLCSNPNNPANTKITSGVSVSSAVTSYVVFEFSEKVRFSDNAGKELTLNLDVYDKNTGVYLDKNIIQGKLYSFDGERMIFSYTVPSTMNGKATDIVVRGISPEQSSFVNGSFDLYLYDGDGNKANTGNQVSSCYITDIAGNTLDWNQSKKDISSITYDNIAPKLTKISIDGNMITSESTKTADGLADGVDRTAVFAGAGDWLQFTLHFSENVNVNTTGTMSAVLNVRDADGEYIKLPCSKSGATIQTDKLSISNITFYPEDMGKRICVTGIENVSSIADAYGNAMATGNKYAANLSSITLMPSQGIYTDTDVPVITTPLSADAEGKYVPIIPASLGTGEYFTFPIVIHENVTNTELVNTSYVEGQKLGVAMVREGEKLPFQWYISGNETIDSTKFCAAQTVADNIETYQYDQIDGQTLYLHVKLNKSIDYGYTVRDEENGIFFDASIYVVARDNAGNITTETFPIYHQVDYCEPGGSIATTFTHSVDFTNLKSTITSQFNVWDDLGIEEISYFWTYTTMDANGVENTNTTATQTVDLSDSFYKNYSQEVALEIPFGENDSSGRAGSAYLTISYKDFAGYNGSVAGSEVGAEENATVNSVYTYDFTKAKSNYSVVTGTKISPLLAPQVYLSAPTSSATAGTDRTLVYISYGADDTTGETKYFVYDPATADGYDATLDLVGDVLALGNNATNTKANGKWSTAVGSITDGVGTFSSRKNFGTDDYTMMKEFINNAYGSFEISFVTSSNFGVNYDFTLAESTVETVTVYLANNAEYDISITGVKDAISADAMSRLDYVAGNVPAQNLDNVEISLLLSNVTSAEAIAEYGLLPLDFANSKIELLYYGEDKLYEEEVIYTWPLVEAAEQAVVIPEGITTKMGWYGLRTTTVNMNGSVSTTKLQQFYFMDNRVVDIALGKYYKSYDNENAYISPLVAKNENLTALAVGETIEVALGTEPGEGWSLDTYITFIKGENTNSEKYGIEELVKVRVFNKNDADYETNAIWIKADELIEFQYTPVYVETITAESYGTIDDLKLPLYDGNNLICYELVNTNGIVKSYEVSVYAYAKADELELDVEYTEISERTGGIMEVTVNPMVSENVDLTNSDFGYVELRAGSTEDTYVFRDDFDCEFWLLDQNGNLATKSVAVSDIDGEAPDFVGFTTNTMWNNDTEDYYHFVVYAYDREGAIDADELTLTFDENYSAVLMGLTGEERINNTERVTMKVPINREQDAQTGEYLLWESYEPGNNGIYRTKLLHEGPKDGYEGYIEVEIWGVWRYDEEYNTCEDPSLYENADESSLTFTVQDANGNISSNTRNYDGSNYLVYHPGKYYITIAEFDEDGSTIVDENPEDDKPVAYLNKEGELGLYSTIPFSKIYSYGATTQREVQTEWPGNTYLYFTLPMIQQDGLYTIEFMDLFGDMYEQTIEVSEFGTIGIDVLFSENEFTNNDVTVTAVASLTGDSIASIQGTTESGQTIKGTVDELDAAKAYITMPENGKVTITTTLGEERIVAVSNIDKTLESASIMFLDSMGNELAGTESILEEEVAAYVICEEDIEGVGCELRYVFPRGSKKGDTYTFTYADMAGNEGTIIATLPCDISEVAREENWVDTEAPLVNTALYGMRNKKYQLITEIVDPHHIYVEEGGETYDYDNLAVALASEDAGMASYVAQGYKMILDIEDDSETKLVVQTVGSAAPTSYTTAVSGSNVENVNASGNVITISENVEFDLYIIDASNHVTAVKDIKVTTIDKEAPEYGVTYEVLKDEVGNDYVYAWFEPNIVDSLEMIYPLDKSMPAKKKQVGINALGEPIWQLRYYFVFTDNGTKTFRYVDEYGNEGECEANVKGFSNAVPEVVGSTIWSGTIGNVKPSESGLVNKDVVANININKAIRNAQLYWYDETAQNYKGNPVGENEPVSISFSGTNIYVTYAANVEKAIMVEFVAKDNGKKGYLREALPAIGCIDKEAPEITVNSAELSNNKRYMTITLQANEAVVMSEFQKQENMFQSYEYEFKTTHTWLAKDAKEKILHFTDKAGNHVTYTITENSTVDTTVLTAVFSATDDHSDATSNPSKVFKLKAGDSLWVKTNKAAEVAFETQEPNSVSKDTWTELIIPELEGVNLLTLTDSYTKEVMQKTIAIQPKDYIAPEITFEVDTVVLKGAATVNEMLQEIRSGVTIVDNKDTISDYEVEGTPDTMTPGIYELTYRAVDSSGNVGKAYRNLYIMEEGAAVLYINGKPALPYGRTYIFSKELKLTLDGFENPDLLTVKIRDGFRSVGQMKHSTTTIENMETTVPKNGFYTIYMRTQERAEYVTYLYVEE